MPTLLLFLLPLLLLIPLGCDVEAPDVSPTKDSETPEKESSPRPAPKTGIAKGTVVSTMASGGYTYVEVETGSEFIWAAGPPTSLEKGAEVSLNLELAMHDFHSSTLDRTFDVIYFVTSFGTGSSSGHSDLGAHDDSANDWSKIDIEKPEGGHTVAELWAQREDLAGQEVAVRGKVVKFLPGIMGRNWLHVRDGSGAQGTNDLTVTTTKTVNVGDTVLLRGPVTIDKDFGAGYRYDLLLEDAQIEVE